MSTIVQSSETCGEMEYVDPYRTAPYLAWVAVGHCPAISLGKSWCSGLRAHSGLHHSPYVQGDGKVTHQFWTQTHVRNLRATEE